MLEPHYLLNIPDHHTIKEITNKFAQYELAIKAGIPVPKTFIVRGIQDLQSITDEIPFPAFVKGTDVTRWREKIGTSVKGFIAQNEAELLMILNKISDYHEGILIQEIIPGPDTNHYKASCYVSVNGEILLSIGLQKIRQLPVNFGFGCLVKSVKYPELLDIGMNLFNKIGFKGVGSAEFKLDERDGNLKLIELNPRYWQQVALAEKCGMNFPLVNYLDLLGKRPTGTGEFCVGIKWVNIFCDIDSYREYRERGTLSFKEWLGSLRGEKIFSTLSRDDMVPGMYDIFIENGVRRVRRRLARLFRRNSSRNTLER